MAGRGVKLLSDSNVFTTAIAQVRAELQDEVAELSSGVIDNYFDNLPRESNGDPVPSSGLYVSGKVIKIV